MGASWRLRLRAAAALAACTLALLPAPATAKLPAAVPLRLACEACNGTLFELGKHVTAQRHRLGLGAHTVARKPRQSAWLLPPKTDAVSPDTENAVTDALETVCAEGHRVFSTYSAPPLKMKQACVAPRTRAHRMRVSRT
jgi:hypothetical protein